MISGVSHVSQMQITSGVSRGRRVIKSSSLGRRLLALKEKILSLLFKLERLWPVTGMKADCWRADSHSECGLL